MMSLEQVREQVFPHSENFFFYLSDGHWTLAHAHEVLRENRLGLLETAGLAMAIASFQCSTPETVYEKSARWSWPDGRPEL